MKTATYGELVSLAHAKWFESEFPNRPQLDNLLGKLRNLRQSDTHTAFHAGVRWAMEMESRRQKLADRDHEMAAALTNAEYLPDGP